MNMRPWVLVLSLVAILAGLVALSRTSHGSGVHGVASPSVVDSSAVVRVRDSLATVAAQERRRADSLQAYLDTCPADTVPRWFARNVPVAVHDTAHDTVRIPAPLARAVAESLVVCHADRDSLAGEVTLWKTRDAAHAEAYRIAQERPVVVGDTSPPSRATWAAVGAAGALVGVTTILLLVR